MNENKLRYITTVITALVLTGIALCISMLCTSSHESYNKVRAGFILDGDESTPYTANYINSINIIKNEYDENLETVIKCNVPYEDSEEVIRELVEKEGCNLIIANSYGYGEYVKKSAASYPEVQFCNATCDNANTEPVYGNYHTFMGEIYEGRYVVGRIAGLKLKEMIVNNIIDENEAYVGYVGAFPCAEVISGYTAFLMGVREECPTAVMRVRYIDSWSDYALEKQCAKKLIEEGCVIISQHSDTIGPATACETAGMPYPVYHCGYNQDMINVAPTTSLAGCKIDWTPYMSAVVRAVLEGKTIESVVKGHIHGNDAGAGFSEGWVKMLEINRAIAVDGTKEMIEDTIESIEEGDISVFSGDYTGVNPDNPNDTIDLNSGYIENEHASAPSFSYILKDVVIVEQD